MQVKIFFKKICLILGLYLLNVPIKMKSLKSLQAFGEAVLDQF